MQIGPWPKNKRLRNKPQKTKKPKDNSVRSGFLSVFILLLFIANLMFVVSILFHSLRAAGGEKKYQISNTEDISNRRQKKIKIEIFNGCGVDKLARNLTNFIRNKQGFDVVDFKDYERIDIPETLVIDRRFMDRRNAIKVAAAIGVKSEQIFPQLSQARNSDVSIIIGADYKKLKAFK